MASVKSRPVFNESLLPEGKRRWGSFGAGLGFQCIGLAAILVVPMLMPQKFEAMQHYFVMQVEAPVIEVWKPQPPPKPVMVKHEVIKEPPKPEIVEPPKPKIINPVFSAPVVKPVTRKVQAPEMTEVAKVFPDPNPTL